MCPKNGGQYIGNYLWEALWDIHGIHVEYSWGIHGVYVCIGYVSGMYRVCIGNMLKATGREEYGEGGGEYIYSSYKKY